MFIAVRTPPGGSPTDEAGSSPGVVDSTPDVSYSDDSRADAAQALLADLATGLEHGTRAQVRRLGAGRQAGRELESLLRNIRALGVTDLQMRYDDRPAARPGASDEVPDDAWVGDVRLRWRLHGFDANAAEVQVPVTFSRAGRRPARFVTARAVETTHRDVVPMWLLGDVSVTRTSRSLVVTAGGRRAVPSYARLADRAVADVRRVLPRWPGRLVVEVPGDQDALARVLGSTSSDYSQIAAVTTTEDGSARTEAPVRIVVNARVFDPLGPRASQIVMSHEATHAATGAALSSMPTWLLEGFADYVALDHVDLPVQITASQALARVRAEGPPSRLPTRTQFETKHVDLGAAYESAWLACRLLGRTYGERRLVRLYRVMDAGTPAAQAFRTVLGTDLRTFTDAWRSDLRRLAG